jgi:hypothetical protein
MFLNCKKTFQNFRLEYSLRTNLEVTYFTDLRQTRGAKEIPKTVYKTRLKTKEITQATQIGYLQCFWKIH